MKGCKSIPFLFGKNHAQKYIFFSSIKQKSDTLCVADSLASIAKIYIFTLLVEGRRPPNPHYITTAKAVF
jgi:hypothetical protein